MKSINEIYIYLSIYITLFRVPKSLMVTKKIMVSTTDPRGCAEGKASDAVM
jgi:hypothetical protein